MTLFGIRHTARWLLHNVGEFDRRHLHCAGVWLFGQRPVRPQRPPRRILTVLFLGAWFALLTSSLPVLQVILMAAVLATALLLILAVASLPLAIRKLKGWRHRA